MADLKTDIDKYLKGELSPQEMHALEKKALSDPFLEAALEGAGQLPPDTLTDDLNILEASLSKRIAEKEGKVISLWTWPARIAAGLAFIAVATWLIVNLSVDQQQKDLALTEEVKTPPAEKEESPKTTEPVNADREEEAPKAEPRGEPKPKLNPAKTETPEAPAPIPEQPAPVAAIEESERSSEQDVADNALSKDAGPVVAEEIIADGKGVASEESRADDKAKKAAPAARRFNAQSESQENANPAPSGNLKNSSPYAKVIKGQITGDDGTGLPGVNILIKGSNIGAVSDENGKYQITLRELNDDLVFSFIGYSSKEVDVKNVDDEIDVRLEEDASQLSEVVVVGYGVERTGNEDLISTVEFAAPDGGRKAFKQYLEKNLVYPEQALTNNVEGKVTVQFNVETSGALSGFKIIRGIGNGCDEEVIRLIKSGPKWTATKKNENVVPDRVKVRMRFALPKKKK